jgi:hypothetical protein
VDNMELMAVLYSRNSLSEYTPSLIFIHAIWVLLYEIVKVTAISQLLYKIKLIVGVNDLIKANDGWMRYELHTADLLIYMSFRYIVQFGFVDDLDGDAESCENMAGAFDYGKVAGA